MWGPDVRLPSKLGKRPSDSFEASIDYREERRQATRIVLELARSLSNRSTGSSNPQGSRWWSTGRKASSSKSLPVGNERWSCRFPRIRSGDRESFHRDGDVRPNSRDILRFAGRGRSVGGEQRAWCRCRSRGRFRPTRTASTGRGRSGRRGCSAGGSRHRRQHGERINAAGIRWLQNMLGDGYRVHEVPLSNHFLLTACSHCRVRGWR